MSHLEIHYILTPRLRSLFVVNGSVICLGMLGVVWSLRLSSLLLFVRLRSLNAVFVISVTYLVRFARGHPINLKLTSFSGTKTNHVLE